MCVLYVYVCLHIIYIMCVYVYNCTSRIIKTENKSVTILRNYKTEIDFVFIALKQAHQ